MYINFWLNYKTLKTESNSIWVSSCDLNNCLHLNSSEPLSFSRRSKNFNCLKSLPVQNMSFLDQRECYIVLV